MNDEGNENQFSKLTSKIDLQNNCPCVSNDIRIIGALRCSEIMLHNLLPLILCNQIKT